MSEAPLPVIVNRSGGTARRLGDALRDKLEAAFAATGQAVAIELVEGNAISRRVEAAVRGGAERVVVGGGDGTLGGAAAVLAGGDAVLAVLPLGTRNHFARQLGVPLDLAAAAKLAVSGSVEAVDLGRAGDRVFINNASVGEYTRLVRHRDDIAGPKWLATIPAAWHVLRRPRPKALCLAIDDVRDETVTPLLFIGNNRYSLDPATLGQRESLSDGVLSVHVVPRFGWLALIGFAVKVVLGRGDPGRHFQMLAEAREVRIEGEGRIEIALDGEVETLPLPLQCRIEPGALRVVVG